MRKSKSRFMSVWPLRLSVPVVLLLFIGLMAGAVYQLNIRAIETQVEGDAVNEMTRHVTGLQRSFERAFGVNEPEQVQQELAQDRVDLELKSAFVSDEHQRIVAGTRREYIGKPLAERLAELDLPWPGLDWDALMTSVHSRQVGQVLLSPRRDALLAVFPVKMGAVDGRIRGDRIGTILFVRDLMPSKVRAAREVARPVGVFSVAMATFTGLLFFLVNRVVVRRVERVVSTARRFAAGEGQARARLPGGDEIAEIGAAFDTMADAVTAFQSRLRASEENMAVTLKSIGDAVIATDEAGRITRMNPAAERLTGWMLADATGRPLPEVLRMVNSQTRQPATNPVQLLAECGEVVVDLGIAPMLLARDGREYQISGSAALIRNGAGDRIGVVIVFSDGTEKFKMTEALAAAKERLDFALGRSRIGAWELDVVSRSAIRSPLHDQIFGYEQLLTNWTYEIFLQHVLPEDRVEVNRTFQAAISNQADWVFECRIRRADGEVRWIAAAGGHQRDAEGQWVRIAGIVQDITVRKLADLAVQDQLQELQRWYEAMLNREARTLALKGEVNQLLAAGGQPARYPSAEPTAVDRG